MHVIVGEASTGGKVLGGNQNILLLMLPALPKTRLQSLERQAVSLLVSVEGERRGEQVVFDEGTDLADSTAEDAWGWHSHLRLLTQQIGRRQRLKSTACLPVRQLIFACLNSSLMLSWMEVCVPERIRLCVV